MDKPLPESLAQDLAIWRAVRERASAGAQRQAVEAAIAALENARQKPPGRFQIAPNISDIAREIHASTAEALGDQLHWSTLATSVMSLSNSIWASAHRPPSAESEASESWMKLVVGYRKESQAQTALMWAYHSAATLLCASTLWITFHFGHDGMDRETMWITLVMDTFLLAMAGAAGWQARECRRTSAESRRIMTQLSLLDRYLEPLPAFGRNLLRGIMMQGLFPMRQHEETQLSPSEVFPSVKQLMESLLPEWDEVEKTETEEPEAGSSKLLTEGSSKDIEEGGFTKSPRD